MIVGEQFLNDDLSVAWRQHDVYRKALEILVHESNRYARMARHILEDEEYFSWGSVDRVDHRTLQPAHDLLAAVWRWKYLNAQTEQPATLAKSIEETWLDWLSATVASWVDEPEFIRLLQIILSNQNEDTGYAAEATIVIKLVQQYDKVDWNEEIYLANLEGLRRFPSDILKKPVGQSLKPLDKYNTYSFGSQKEMPNE